MYGAEKADRVFGIYDVVADMVWSDVDSRFEKGPLSHAVHPWLAGIHLDAPVEGIRPTRCVSLDDASLALQTPCTPNTIGGRHDFTQAPDFCSPVELSIGVDWEHAAALPSLVASPSPSASAQQTTPPHSHSSCPDDDALFLALSSLLQAEPACWASPVAGSPDKVSNTGSEGSEPVYTHPSTPPSGPFEPAPTTPNTIRRSGSFPFINKRSRGRQVPLSPDGKPVRVYCKNGVIRARPFVCPYPGCAKTFSRNEHVKRHIRCLHSDDEGWTCQYGGDMCRKTFTRKDNYQQHVRKDHPDQIWENPT